jgi:hypothetical protein
MSYMNTYRERLDELSLNWQQQSLLLSELRVHLNDEDDREAAVELIKRLRKRPDIAESVGREIDSLLASLPASAGRQSWGAPSLPGPEKAPEPAVTRSEVATGGEWRRDPYGRYEQRFWNGTAWTDHVSTGGRQSTDPPGDRARAPGAVAAVAGQPEGPFSTGAYVGLIIASIFCFGLVGIIVGAINLKKPARASQAKVLLIVGIVACVLSVIVTGASSGG